MKVHAIEKVSFRPQPKISIRFTPMTGPRKPLYEASTQYKNWRFSPEKLVNTREALNAAAVAVIRDAFEADEVQYLKSTVSKLCLCSTARLLF